MFDYDREYSGFKSEVESMCTRPAELERVRNEFKLFEERGWQKYIVVLARIMRGIEEDGFLFDEICTELGSARNSYALRKFRRGETDVNGLLGSRKGEEILFNDALRLTFSIHSPHDDFNVRSEINLDNILDPIVRQSGLFYKQKLLRNDNNPDCGHRMYQEELLVLSTASIPDEDVSLIVNETKESSEEEAERLRKYLIIRVRVIWYERTPEEALRRERRF